MKLSVYLVKNDEFIFENVKKYNAGKLYDLSDKYGFDVSIFVGEFKANEPSWLSFINGALNGIVNSDEYYNSSTRAIIFVKIDEYYLAYTFGFGRYLIDDEYIVRDFGLKVALNTVDFEKLKEIDKLTISEKMIQSKQMSPRDITVEDFEVNKKMDFLKTISGKTITDELKNNIKGNESFQFTKDIVFGDLENISQRLLDKYKSDKYKEKFGWVDNISMVKSKKLKHELNKKVYKKIIDREDVYLLVPEIYNALNIVGISHTQNENFFPFDISSIYNYTGKVSEENFERFAIYLYDEEKLSYKTKLINCIFAEIEYNDSIYTILDNRWFKIDSNFYKDIDDYIKSINICDLNLPNCLFAESEGNYNERVAKDNENIFLMDKKLVDNVEVCDLLSRDMKFIHVKVWTSSSTFSHLLSQGRVASEIINNDLNFREKVIEKIENETFDFEIDKLRDYKSSNIEIVYGVVHKYSDPLYKLPFFSKVNLRDSVEVLKKYGFKVSYIPILRDSK